MRPSGSDRFVAGAALLGISLVGLVGLVGTYWVLFAVWLLWLFVGAVWLDTFHPDAPEHLSAILALAYAGAGLAAMAVTWLAARRWQPRLELSWTRLVLALASTYGVGIAVALGAWLNCYHQADMLRASVAVLLTVVVVLAIPAGAFARTGWSSVVLVVPALVVAATASEVTSPRLGFGSGGAGRGGRGGRGRVGGGGGRRP